MTRDLRRPDPLVEPPRPRWHRWRGAWWVLFVVLLLGVWWTGRDPTGEQLSYSELKEHVAAGDIERVEVGAQRITGTFVVEDDGEARRFHAFRVEDDELVPALEAAGVEIVGEPEPSGLGWLMLLWIALPVLMLWFVFRSIGTRAGRAGMAFGKSPARLVEQRPDVDFGDVAGCDEAKAELREVVDFLRSPTRYEAMGAKVPKGVLLVGPPGTGKTLLARAVAGEAKVPFYSLSGSDFVEMFVGVGAARVRDLFDQATQQAPCIVFIDELDAIGRRRGVHLGVVNDEREQTLNQLLVELDGFEPNSGVILLAATNRPDVLDPALLRPGRFDRQVVLDAPDFAGRLAILRVHARGKPLVAGADLESLARVTPGLSGADLANVINEAALAAARREHAQITQRDLEDAVEKVIAGPERRSRVLSPDEKRRVAVHEVGHALVAHYGDLDAPVRKISIVPRGRAALGYTMQVPEQDRLLLTRSELLARLEVMVAGRAAEILVLGEPSTGSEDDLARATILTRRMVAQLGMGESTGLARTAHMGDEATEAGPFAPHRDCSEATAQTIDAEVERLLAQAHADATARLRERRELLDRITEQLLRHEVLDGQALLALLPPDPPARLQAMR